MADSCVLNVGKDDSFEGDGTSQLPRVKISSNFCTGKCDMDASVSRVKDESLQGIEDRGALVEAHSGMCRKVVSEPEFSIEVAKASEDTLSDNMMRRNLSEIRKELRLAVTICVSGVAASETTENDPVDPRSESPAFASSQNKSEETDKSLSVKRRMSLDGDSNAVPEDPSLQEFPASFSVTTLPELIEQEQLVGSEVYNLDRNAESSLRSDNVLGKKWKDKDIRRSEEHLYNSLSYHETSSPSENRHPLQDPIPSQSSLTTQKSTLVMASDTLLPNPHEISNSTDGHVDDGPALALDPKSILEDVSYPSKSPLLSKQFCTNMEKAETSSEQGGKDSNKAFPPFVEEKVDSLDADHSQGIAQPTDDLRIRVGVFVVIFLLEIATGYDAGAIPAVLLELKGEFQMTDFEQGILGALPFVGMVIVSPFVGRLMNKVSPKKLLIVSIGGNFLSTVLLAASVVRWLLFASRLLIGLTQAAFSIYAPVWVDEFAPPEKTTLWMGLVQGGVVMGTMLGYLITGFFREADKKWQWSIVIQVLMILILLVIFCFIPKKYIDYTSHESAPFIEQERLGDGESSVGGSSPRHSYSRRLSSALSLSDSSQNPAAPADLGLCCPQQTAEETETEAVASCTDGRALAMPIDYDRKNFSRADLDGNREPVIHVSFSTSRVEPIREDHISESCTEPGNLRTILRQNMVPVTVVRADDGKGVSSCTVVRPDTNNTESSPNRWLIGQEYPEQYSNGIVEYRDLHQTASNLDKDRRSSSRPLSEHFNSPHQSGKAMKRFLPSQKMSDDRSYSSLSLRSTSIYDFDGNNCITPCHIRPIIGTGGTTVCMEALTMAAARSSRMGLHKKSSDIAGAHSSESGIRENFPVGSQSNLHGDGKMDLSHHPQQPETHSSYRRPKLSTWSALKSLFSNKMYLSVTVSLCALFFEVTGIQFWSTRFFEEVMLVDKKTVLISFSATAATAPVAGVLIGGILIDQVGGYKTRSGLLKTFFTLSLFGFFALVAGVLAGVIPRFPVAISCMWVILFLGGAILPATTGIVIAAVEPELRTFASGLSMFLYTSTGYILGTLLPGALMEIIGLHNGMRLILLWSTFGLIGIIVGFYVAWKENIAPFVQANQIRGGNSLSITGE